LFAIALPYFTALARWGAYSRARYVTHSPEDDPVHPVLRRATTHGGTAIAIIISALMSAGLAGPLELTWPHLEATLYFFSLALLCFLPASYWGVWWWAQLMAGYFQLKPPA
jgi:hypothetical protein